MRCKWCKRYLEKKRTYLYYCDEKCLKQAQNYWYGNLEITYQEAKILMSEL